MCSKYPGRGLSAMNTSNFDGDATPVRIQVDAKAVSFAMRTSGMPSSDDAFFPGIYPVATMTAYLSQIFFIIFPQRPVVVAEEWAKYVNPSIKYLSTTVFKNLMEPSPTLDTVIYLRTSSLCSKNKGFRWQQPLKGRAWYLAFYSQAKVVCANSPQKSLSHGLTAIFFSQRTTSYCQAHTLQSAYRDPCTCASYNLRS